MSTKKHKILCFTDSLVISTDALVHHDTAAALFGIKENAFRMHVDKIIAAHGLQRVQTGKTWKYRLQSIQEVIRKCAEKGIPLYTNGHGHKFSINSPEL